jgi:hypothetical protein
MTNQINQYCLSSLLAAIAIILTFGAFGATVAQEKKSPGERYGSREPRTCADKKAPAKGAITAALAAKYFICKAEGIDGQYLYLVENVKVEVGAGRPYNPNMDLNVPEIDVKFPVYPIRGSLTKYQCKDPQIDYIKIQGRTCNRTEQPNAKGFCYKTTFGDWSCYMTELFGKNEDYFPDVPPPGGKTMAENKTTTNDQPAETKTTKPTAVTKDEPAGIKDENGFVKPDFSEMEKYFDITRYEYNFSTRELSFVTKMKKANNPNAWLVEFFDADGARLKWGNTILHSSSSPDPQVGQVVRVYASTPTEKQMRDEVKKIVITRILN